MPKALNITSTIESQLKAALGDEQIDSSQLVVFEALAASTAPLSKRGSLFDKGVITRSTLAEMAESLSAGHAVPMHTLHRSGGELPIGKVFAGAVEDQADGTSVLRVLFYLPKSKVELVADINNSVIDEVSVGLMTKKILCSECGWDYLSAEASFMNIMDRTCGNEHEIGVNGVHARMVGMDNWLELSLVSRGAAKNPKIVSRAKSLLGTETRERLAASGFPAEAVLLFASHKQETKKMSGTETKIDLATFMDAHATLKADVIVKDAKITDLTAQLTALNTKLEGLEKQVTASAAELQKNLDAAIATATAATEFLKTHTKAALVASGKTDPQVPEGVEDMIKAITETGLKLHQVIGADGKGASSDSSAETAKVASDAFKTRK